MEQAIRDRFNDRILDEARQRYGIAPDAIHLLDGFESYMYEFEKDGRSFILRLGHSRRRTPDLIRGEVDWINYLAAGGASVARAVNAESGELVELIDDGQGGQFLATAFVKASGGSAWKMNQWSERLWVNYGRLIGRIHALSKSYTPTNPAWKRPHWDDPMMVGTLEFAPEETFARQKAGTVLAYLKALPRDEDGYGMIHQDAHGGNFFVDEDGRITLFDFDDCVYGHFAYDLAMVLFYAVTNEPDSEALARRFWPCFWQGYREENELDPAWLAEIPHFMKLRELDLYAVIQRDMGPEQLSQDSWARQFMDGRKQKIDADEPVLTYVPTP